MGTTEPRGDRCCRRQQGSGTRQGHGGPCPKGTSLSPPAAPQPSDPPTPPGRVGLGEPLGTAGSPWKGRCHGWGRTLGSRARRWWAWTPSSPSRRPPQPAERIPRPPKGNKRLGGGGAAPRLAASTLWNLPPAAPVKPVSNWGGVTASCSGWSTAKPDPTVPTPKQQGKARPPLSQSLTLSCWVLRAPGDPRTSAAAPGPPRAGGSGPSSLPTQPARGGWTPCHA